MSSKEFWVSWYWSSYYKEDSSWWCHVSIAFSAWDMSYHSYTHTLQTWTIGSSGNHFRHSLQFVNSEELTFWDVRKTPAQCRQRVYMTKALQSTTMEGRPAERLQTSARLFAIDDKIRKLSISTDNTDSYWGENLPDLLVQSRGVWLGF